MFRVRERDYAIENLGVCIQSFWVPEYRLISLETRETRGMDVSGVFPGHGERFAVGWTKAVPAAESDGGDNLMFEEGFRQGQGEEVRRREV